MGKKGRAILPCIVEGCDQTTGHKGTARGYCHKHYRRWQKYGDVMNIGPLAWTVGPRKLLARTCYTCGFFLDGSWFYSRGAEKTSQNCRKCDSITSMEHAAKTERLTRHHQEMQAITIPTATRHREEWTERDLEILADKELTMMEKAITLKRTYYAVGMAAHRYGFQSKPEMDKASGQWIIKFPEAS